MSLNYVVISGKVSRPPRRVTDGEKSVFVFPLAVRSPQMSFPILAVDGPLPHYVTYYNDRGLAEQPVVSVVATVATRNIIIGPEDVARMLRKANVDRDVITRVLEILPADLKIRRVVTELRSRPENIFPGGVW